MRYLPLGRKLKNIDGTFSQYLGFRYEHSGMSLYEVTPIPYFLSPRNELFVPQNFLVQNRFSLLRRKSERFYRNLALDIL